MPHPPLSPAEIEQIDAWLATIAEPLQPLDASGLDGFLCGVLVQPEPVPERHWWPHVLDVDGRPAPAAFATAPLRALVVRRHAELAGFIARRDWFDPWVFAEDEADVDAVVTWAGGFALALETFPELLGQDDEATTEALALLYRHLDTGHLDEAEALLEAIAVLEPPYDAAAAVQDLVRATMLLADAAGLPAQRPPRRPATPRPRLR